MENSEIHELTKIIDKLHFYYEKEKCQTIKARYGFAIMIISAILDEKYVGKNTQKALSIC